MAETKIYEFLDIYQTLICFWPPFSSLLLQFVDKSLTITKIGTVRNMCEENLLFERSHEYFKVCAKKYRCSGSCLSCRQSGQETK